MLRETSIINYAFSGAFGFYSSNTFIINLELADVSNLLLENTLDGSHFVSTQCYCSNRNL